MHILVTGACGFIGFHLAKRLSSEQHTVIGLDNLNDYYDVKLKRDRLSELLKLPHFRFVEADLADDTAMEDLFAQESFTHVVNLAAQAGVRYSLENPKAYIRSNLNGFANVLEGCRNHKVGHLVYASSSSVYGLNTAQPFSEQHNVDHPVSLYAATKKSNELMAHSYAHLYGLPCTGLRFFTVYGPWGRPDMAPHLFASAIMQEKPIKVFNHGNMYRDFTYIDDIIEGVIRIMDKPALADTSFDLKSPNPATSTAPWRIYNIGNNTTVCLNDFIETLENALGRKAIRTMLPMQPGDVQSTYAEVKSLQDVTGFTPSTPLEEGIARFADWYMDYYHSKNCAD